MPYFVYLYLRPVAFWFFWGSRRTSRPKGVWSIDGCVGVPQRLLALRSSLVFQVAPFPGRALCSENRLGCSKALIFLEESRRLVHSVAVFLQCSLCMGVKASERGGTGDRDCCEIYMLDLLLVNRNQSHSMPSQSSTTTSNLGPGGGLMAIRVSHNRCHQHGNSETTDPAKHELLLPRYGCAPDDIARNHNNQDI